MDFVFTKHVAESRQGVKRTKELIFTFSGSVRNCDKWGMNPVEHGKVESVLLTSFVNVFYTFSVEIQRLTFPSSVPP